MTRPAQAGPILASGVAAALALGGCGGSPHHSTSSAAASPPSATSTTSTTSATSTTSGSVTTPPATGGHLTVAPAAGHPGSTLRFTVITTTPAGRHGQTDVSYALSIAGPQGSGCVAQHAGAVDVRHAGEPVALTVGPSQLGGPWCVGSYTARVTELARPACGAGQVCPQFIRVVAVIGPVAFRITG